MIVIIVRETLGCGFCPFFHRDNRECYVDESLFIEDRVLSLGVFKVPKECPLLDGEGITVTMKMDGEVDEQSNVC